MSRKLKIAPAPHAGYLYQNYNGQRFIITNSCISRVNPDISDEEFEALETVPFDISVQSCLENAIQNAPNLMRLPEDEGEIVEIREDVDQAIQNFE